MTTTDPDELLRAKLEGETAKMPWRELQHFFANGSAIYVAPALDLVEVAAEMSSNNETQISAWQSKGELGQISDALALEWYEANALMWSVVVRPWVLVQPILLDKECG
ncbi:MAG: DUF2288 domain-containing protein [Gammaproteobacteria bacterium]|nr:DUF2288 domain-containing protein [Gammaproteobacteria bacterium]MBQ0841026.1 DUF2288 domain-containing protein [Gammaproteobacteria bacterium]